MSKTLIGLIVIIAVLLSWVPLALIARSRAKTSTATAVHLILDMDKQQKFKPQRGNELFADSRDMRPQIEGTLAREDLSVSNEALVDPETLKMIDGQATTTVFKTQSEHDSIVLGQQMGPDGKAQFIVHIPIPVTSDLMRRGQERFNIYCSPCHGAAGYGDGMVHVRATELQTNSPGSVNGWVQPANFHTNDIRNRRDGDIFNTITNGIRTMPRYDKQISIMDRWAIVAYVRALQVSQAPATMPVDLAPAPATKTK
jgi:mono/diheme cytochrome c family protein